MRKLILLLTLLAMTVASHCLLACTSSLCSGTHTLTGFKAVYTGCDTKQGGGYSDANLQIDCSQTLASGTGTSGDTAEAAHEWVIYDNGTKQAIVAGANEPIPQNGNGYGCNLTCGGTGGSSPLVASFTHSTTQCQASVGGSHYVSHTVYYGTYYYLGGWTSSNTVLSNVITP